MVILLFFFSCCTSGGTISNLYSILLARYHYFPQVKTEGMQALPRLAMFTSAHVSVHDSTLLSLLCSQIYFVLTLFHSGIAFSYLVYFIPYSILRYFIDPVLFS